MRIYGSNYFPFAGIARLPPMGLRTHGGIDRRHTGCMARSTVLGFFRKHPFLRLAPIRCRADLVGAFARGIHKRLAQPKTRRCCPSFGRCRAAFEPGFPAPCKGPIGGLVGVLVQLYRPFREAAPHGPQGHRPACGQPFQLPQRPAGGAIAFGIRPGRNWQCAFRRMPSHSRDGFHHLFARTATQTSRRGSGFGAGLWRLSAHGGKHRAHWRQRTSCVLQRRPAKRTIRAAAKDGPHYRKTAFVPTGRSLKEVQASAWTDPCRPTTRPALAGSGCGTALLVIPSRP